MSAATSVGVRLAHGPYRRRKSSLRKSLIPTRAAYGPAAGIPRPHRTSSGQPAPQPHGPASAAIHAAYIASAGKPPATAPTTSADAFALAAHHGDEHVIKLADTAIDAHSWTGDDLALAAVQTAAVHIKRE